MTWSPIRDHLFATFSHQPEAFRRLFFYTDHAGLGPLRNRLGPGHSLEAQVEVVLESCEKQDLLAGLLAELERYDPSQHTPAGSLPAYAPPPLPDPGVLAEPGELAPGSRLPFGRNALFTGREGPLLALARALLHDPAAGRGTLVTQTIEGMGGIGKTQTAICVQAGAVDPVSAQFSLPLAVDELVQAYGAVREEADWLSVDPTWGPLPGVMTLTVDPAVRFDEHESYGLGLSLVATGRYVHGTGLGPLGLSTHAVALCRAALSMACGGESMSLRR